VPRDCDQTTNVPVASLEEGSSGVREFTTIIGVPGHGGAINGPGPTVVGGMLFVNSGYAFLGGQMPGNVLLAFGVK
jgi:hypothetical protein